MKDSLQIRKCMLAKDGVELGEVGKKQLSIKLDNILPLISLDSSLSTEMVYVELDSAVLADQAVIKNAIVDPDYKTEHGTERFVYLTTNVSVLSKAVVRMYYDKKYEDIIVIPNTNLLGGEEDHTAGMAFEVNGYVVGGGVSGRSGSHSSNLLSVEDGNHQKLPLTKSNIKSVNKQLLLPGVQDNTKSKKYLERMVTNDLNYSNVKNTPVGVIELGLPSEVFEDVLPVPFYMIFQSSVSKYSLKYVGGNKKPSANNQLCVFLNF